MDTVQFIDKCLHTDRYSKVEASKKEQKKGKFGIEKRKAIYVTCRVQPYTEICEKLKVFNTFEIES
jgi:hypothetical protein